MGEDTENPYLMPARFVILHHHTSTGEHWDLMIERDQDLATWQLLHDPHRPGAFPVPARRIGEHRKAYLTYEGPISGDRGDVRRVDEGAVEVLAESVERVLLLLDGLVLKGRFVLRADGDGWIFERIQRFGVPPPLLLRG